MCACPVYMLLPCSDPNPKVMLVMRNIKHVKKIEIYCLALAAAHVFF